MTSVSYLKQIDGPCSAKVHFSHLRLQKSTKAPHDAPGQDASVGILPSTAYPAIIFSECVVSMF